MNFPQTLALLLLPLLVLLPTINSHQHADFIVLPGNCSATFACSCTMTYADSYNCSIQHKNASQSGHIAVTSTDDVIPCSALPSVRIIELSFDCSPSPNCGIVHLEALTGRQIVEGASTQPPLPRTVEIVQCSVTNEGQVSNGSREARMHLAPFGVPGSLGVGAFYASTATTAAAQSPCQLAELRLRSVADLRQLSAVTIGNVCPDLVAMTIDDSPGLGRATLDDLLAMSTLQKLRIGGSRLVDFAPNALETVLDSLDEFVQQQPVLEAAPSRDQRNITDEMLRFLQRLQRSSGRLKFPAFIFLLADNSTANVRLSLLLAYLSNLHSPPAPQGLRLSQLDLSHNQLITIPASLSLLPYLHTVQLHHNKISELSSEWLCCTVPEAPDGRCYWFRAAKWTMKVLDLSYNRIERIGDLQPWYEIALAELYLSHNRMKMLHNFNKSSLSQSLLTLDISRNSLTRVSLKELKNLVSLNVSDNALNSLDKTSLPQSSRLESIDLSLNNLSDIGFGIFESMKNLLVIDFRQNCLSQFLTDKFVMPVRYSKGSRVSLKIGGQRVAQICSCHHVYSRIIREESDVATNRYFYPNIDQSDRSTECYYNLPTANEVQVSQPFRKMELQNFLCRFSGPSQTQKLPQNLCWLGNNRTCYESCLYSCSCYRSDHWSFMNMNCSGTAVDTVHVRIFLPVKFLDLSNLRNQQLMRTLSLNSLRWKTPALSHQLLVLQLSNSSIRYISDGAFNYSHQITRLYLDNNLLKYLNSSAIAGLGETLTELTLHNNKLRWIDPQLLLSLRNIATVTLRNNQWICTCTGHWLKLHQLLIRFYKTTQVVIDFEEVTCRLDERFVKDLHEFSNWLVNPQATLRHFGNTSRYKINDHHQFNSTCRLLSNFRQQRLEKIAVTVACILAALMLTIMSIFAIFRRHFLLAVWRLRSRRKRHSKDSLSAVVKFDATLWAHEDDYGKLVKVIKQLQLAAGSFKLRLVTPASFMYNSATGQFLMQSESLSMAAQYSNKVVVMLTTKLLDDSGHDLLALLEEFKANDRQPEQVLIFINFQRNFRPSPANRELDTILQQCRIVYGDRDWQYHLLSLLLLDENEDQNPIDADASGSQEDREQLISHVTMDADAEGQSAGSIHDWSPFHSSHYAKVLLLSHVTCVKDAQLAGGVVQQLMLRCHANNFMTNDSRLSDRQLMECHEVTAELLNATRQFILLLNPSLVSWLRSNQEVMNYLNAVYIGRQFRRRVLAVQMEELTSEDEENFKKLVGHAGDEESGNYFDIKHSRQLPDEFFTCLCVQDKRTD